MNKKILLLTVTGILTIGAVSAAYAKENKNINTNKTIAYGNMMNQGSGNYNKMADIMRNNGFQEAAAAMENKDYSAMNKLMNNLTDEQYNKMSDLMKQNGYGSMS